MNNFWQGFEKRAFTVNTGRANKMMGNMFGSASTPKPPPPPPPPPKTVGGASSTGGFFSKALKGLGG